MSGVCWRPFGVFNPLTHTGTSGRAAAGLRRACRPALLEHLINPLTEAESGDPSNLLRVGASDATPERTGSRQGPPVRAAGLLQNVWLAAQSRLMAVLRRVAMLSRPCPVRILAVSSVKVVSRTKRAGSRWPSSARSSRGARGAWRLVRSVST